MMSPRIEYDDSQIERERRPDMPGSEVKSWQRVEDGQDWRHIDSGSLEIASSIGVMIRW